MRTEPLTEHGMLLPAELLPVSALLLLWAGPSEHNHPRGVATRRRPGCVAGEPR